MWKKCKPYVISAIIALAVGGLAAILTRRNMDIYLTLEKPPFAPPMMLFPIAWTILYILMGISSAIIYKRNGEGELTTKPALCVYALQLIMNFLWTIIFFNLQAFLFAYVWIMLLWAVIIWMIVWFWKISPAAGCLQLPYLAWVTFASVLNLMIFILNK